MSPHLIEELNSISRSYSQGVAVGGAHRHLACRLLLLARCALGYFLMALQAIFVRVSYDHFKFTTAYENRKGRHGGRIGDDGRREPWVLRRFPKPTLPADNAVGVATKFRIFM